MVSDKVAIMHEAAQRCLFQMSDVQRELHKNPQEATSSEQHVARRGRRSIREEAREQCRIRRRQSITILEEKTSIYQGKLHDKEVKNEWESGNEGFEHLLILANSAELLESEGQSRVESSLGSTQGNGDMESENSTLRVLGRIRLTKIRHQARLGNPQLVRETDVRHIHEHADFKSLEDTNIGKSGDADQVDGAMAHKDVQEIGGETSFNIADLSVVSESRTKEIEDVRECTSLAELPATVHQPLQMTIECGELMKQQSDADQLTQVRASKSDGLWKEYHFSSQQKQGHVAWNYHNGWSLSMQHMSEGSTDQHSIDARESRMLRTFERRKKRYGADFQWMAHIQMRQMFDAQKWWMWNQMTAQSWATDIAKQQWLLYTSYVEKEQRRIDAQQRRAQKIQEKRASTNVHRQLNNYQLVEQNQFEERPHNPNVSTGGEQDAIPMEVNQSFQHPTIAEVCEDQYVEPQKQTTNVETEKTSLVGGQMRLTWLKREARLKNSPINVENGKKLCWQRD